MSDPFTLRVPVEPKFRALGSELAARYIDLLGGSDAERQTLSAAVAGALTDLAAAAPAGAACDMAFAASGVGVEVTVRCGAQSTVVRQVLAAAKR
jgi:hypothetical protein